MHPARRPRPADNDLFVDTCNEAVKLLDMRSLDGKKQSSDPVFNAAAQFVGTMLNLQAEAGTCPAVASAVTQLQALFDQVNFNGYTHTALSPSQATLFNSLATTLDRSTTTTCCARPEGRLSSREGRGPGAKPGPFF